MDRRRILALAAALLLARTVLADAPTPAQIIDQIDRLRLPPPTANDATRISMRITNGAGARRESDTLSVISHGANSLVVMLDGPQRGMKILGTAQDTWMYLPNTRRAMRLTPLQRLRGQISIGDISRLRFATDYEAGFAEQATVNVSGRDCLALTLKAKSPAATYAAIALRVDKSTGIPVSADMFAASGRKLKTVLYAEPVTVDGRELIATTTYIDGVDATQRTTVNLLAVARTRVSAGMFRPEALPTEF